MAIRQRMTGAERRLHILEAAAEVFASRGYDGTRMSDVAEAAGVTKPLLYKYFSSKDALFRAYSEREGERFVDELRGAMVDGGRPPATLRRTVTVWLERLTDPNTLKFVDPGTHGAYERARDVVQEVLTGMIVDINPRLGRERARIAAAALQGAAESGGLAWARRPSGLSFDAAVDMLSSFCWEGLRGLRPVIERPVEGKRAQSLSVVTGKPRGRRGAQ